MEQRKAGQPFSWTSQISSTVGTPPIDSASPPDAHLQFGALSCSPVNSEPDASSTLAPCHTSSQDSTLTPLLAPDAAGSPSWVPPQATPDQRCSSTLDAGLAQQYPPGIGEQGKSEGPLSSPPLSPQHSSECGYVTAKSCTAYDNKTHLPTYQTGSSSEVGGILQFSYMELSEATGGFTEGIMGGFEFGTVFKAKIRGSGPYAIKKLHTVSGVGGLQCVSMPWCGTF